MSTSTVAAHSSFLPLLAQARRIGSFLFLAKIYVLLLSFLPLSFLLHSAPRALRSAASCARLSRAAPQRCAARVFPVWPCAVLRGEEPFRAANARAWRRAFPLLMTRPQPAQALLLPTTCTALARHAPLLLFCCYRRLQHAPCSPRAGLNRPVMPPAPGSQRVISAAAPCLCRPPAHCTTSLSRSPAHRAIAPPARTSRLQLCDRRSSSPPLTSTARRCSSLASPPRLAAPRSPPPPCAC